MKPEWETGLRGRLYALGRRAVPLSWRRALRRRLRPERLLGIRKPAVEFLPLPLDPGPATPGRDDVVVLPVIAWTYRRQRPQQLSEALARRGRRVFYGSLEGSGEPGEPVGAAPRVTLLPIAGVRREDPADRRLEGARLEEALAGLSAAKDRFGLAEATLLVESPFWEPLAAVMRARHGWRIAYDCLDAHEAFGSNRPGVFEGAEETLAREADLVVATSEALRARLLPWAKGAHLLPNACDYDLFSRIPDPNPRAGALTVGYAGAVDAWFDRRLVAELARLEPGWTFEIVGGVEDPAFEAPALPNLRFLGERPHREMPGLRARFDVEIIPFRLSPLTHATDPVKLYEAAAAGRGVVATPMESLAPLARRGLVRLGSNAADFQREIAAAASAGPEQVARRRAFARENTWDVRAETLDAWLTAGRGRGTVDRRT